MLALSFEMTENGSEQFNKKINIDLRRRSVIEASDGCFATGAINKRPRIEACNGGASKEAWEGDFGGLGWRLATVACDGDFMT